MSENGRANEKYVADIEYGVLHATIVEFGHGECYGATIFRKVPDMDDPALASFVVLGQFESKSLEELRQHVEWMLRSWAKWSWTNG